MTRRIFLKINCLETFHTQKNEIQAENASIFSACPPWKKSFALRNILNPLFISGSKKALSMKKQNKTKVIKCCSDRRTKRKRLESNLTSCFDKEKFARNILIYYDKKRRKEKWGNLMNSKKEMKTLLHEKQIKKLTRDACIFILIAGKTNGKSLKFKYLVDQ